MKYLVTVADDFGFTEGINKGCIEAHQKGILQEMSLMMDSPATKDGVKLILENKIPGLGIHITLNDIVGTGKYLRTADYKTLLADSSSDYLSKRVEDEIKRFEDLVGRKPSHINGHKNCHLHHKIIDVVSEYAVKNNIYVRLNKEFSDGNSAGEDVNAQLMARDVRLTDEIFEHIVGTYKEAFDGFLDDLRTMQDNTVTEAFFHPAYVDETLRSYSSLTDDRDRDRQLLEDPEFKKEIEGMGFVISDFASLK